MSLLLHLSDLHLGPQRDEDIPDDFKSDIPPLTERTTRYTALKETLEQLAEHNKEKGVPLDAVIISGDITVASNEEGFQKLTEVLGWLGDACPPPGKIVVVPGNHDVKWEVSGDSKAKYELFIKHVRAKGFITPLLEGIDIKHGNIAASTLTDHYLLDAGKQWAIVPINSSHYCGSVEPIGSIPESVWNDLPRMIVSGNPSLKECEVGRQLRRLRLRDVARISVPDQMHAISQLVAAINTEVGRVGCQPVLIGVIHHHLLPVSVREEFKAFESFTNLGHFRQVLASNKFSVVIHGHKHTECIYYDHVHDFLAKERPASRRILVVSSPDVNAARAKPINICRLIQIPDQRHASSISLTDVPSVEHGTKLQLPPPAFFNLWQTSPVGMFEASPFNLVEGVSVDEVYERALALFHGDSSSVLKSNVVCRVASTTLPVQLPNSYPPIPDVAEPERAAWFQKIVTWWQKSAFTRLSSDHHFNHGSRIYRYGQRDIPQLDAVVNAIKKDPRTSRGVITLLNPHADRPEDESSRFPSFCFVQFLVRDLKDRYALEVIGYFRKQEIKYWWPVNVAELALLQAEVIRRVKASVEGGFPKQLTSGIISTFAATAHVGGKIPYILVPATDFDLEENPQKLWDMTYAVCWPGMGNRGSYVTAWQNVLNNLTPPVEQDSDGVGVAIQGVEYLAEVAEHFARNHGGNIQSIASLWKELSKINRHYVSAVANAEGKIEENVRIEWRAQAVSKLNEIRVIINKAFDVSLVVLI